MLVWVWWQLGSGSDDSELRAQLVEEFSGAYPAGPPEGGGVVEVELVARPSSVSLTGEAPTEVWAYNDTVPGSALRVRLGETLRVVLRNELSMATTVHWHGVRVPNTADGVPGVTQAPVEPGQSYTYEFTPPDPGTYWYHSHFAASEQLERGLYGSLVVEHPDEPAWPTDVVWVIDDWLLDDAGQVDAAFNTPSDVEHNGRWGTLVTVNGSTQTLLDAAPGERLRLRLVNASNGRVYAPRFARLPASVIAVDGLPTAEPIPADGFVIAPGNRIDLDIIAPDAPGEFAIVDDFTGEEFPLGRIAVAGAQTTTADFDVPLAERMPTWQASSAVAVDLEYRLAIRRGDGQWEWTINDRAFPDIDPLQVDQGAFVKLRLVNGSQLLHPMHLHGQFFKVLTRNGEPVDEGHFRDTTLLLPGDTIEIGFVALDPGEWAFHCHIQEHAEAGMMTTLVVRPA